MKFSAVIISLLFLLAFASTAEARSSYGTYRTPSYRMPSVRSYSAPRNYKNGGQLYMQKGYFKKSGTYVQPYLKTKPDNYRYNNRKQILGY